MAPDTAEIRTTLETRAKQQTATAGLTPGTRKYKEFMNSQIQPRNISPIVVENAIRTTPAIPGNNPGIFIHQTSDVTVVVNQNGGVITVFGR